MTVLNIRHRTTYRYREPVRLGPHRLMLRPRESRDVRLLSSTLEMTPAASVSWANDVFGNAVATAGFTGLADGLAIESRADRRARRLALAGVRHRGLGHPLSVPLFERGVGRSRGAGGAAVPSIRRAGSPTGRGASCAATRTDTLALLKDMVAGVGGGDRLPEPRGRGHADALADLDRGWGSCRDFAVLFAEAARCLGFGARIISGYLYNPDRARAGRIGVEGSAMRARPMRGPRSSCRARAGSPSIRPTGRSAATISFPLAVGRVIAQVMPMTGTFLGMTDAYLGMSVDVEVTP